MLKNFFQDLYHYPADWFCGNRLCIRYGKRGRPCNRWDIHVMWAIQQHPSGCSGMPGGAGGESYR